MDESAIVPVTPKVLDHIPRKCTRYTQITYIIVSKVRGSFQKEVSFTYKELSQLWCNYLRSTKFVLAAFVLFAQNVQVQL